MKNWLITGGCGFIGTSLIKHLLENNLAGKIRILDNLSTGSRDDLRRVCDFATPGNGVHDNTVELWVGDIRDPIICFKCCHEVDIIVHLAAKNSSQGSLERPKQYLECNVVGTLNMLEAARHSKAKRFIYATPAMNNDEAEFVADNGMSRAAVSLKRVSSRAAEEYCSAYYTSFGVETVTLKYSYIFSPDPTQEMKVYEGPDMHVQSLEGTASEDGRVRDPRFTHMNTLVNAFVDGATRQDVGGEQFHITM